MEKTFKIHIGIVCDQFGNIDRGGAEVQIDNTIRALEKIEGITTEIITSKTRDINRFDFVHFFKSSPNYYFLAILLKNNNIPYVVSTIIYPENFIVDILKYKFIRNTPIIKKLSWTKLQYYLWENSAMLFPNTDEELDFLRIIGVKAKAKVIPNGLDLKEMDSLADENLFYSTYPFLKNQKFVLNIARIHKRKNQKRLVQSCMELNIPIVLIGSNFDTNFYEEIMQLNYSKLYYLGPIFNKELLYGAIKACKIFCLPSTMETPGIAAMEAAYFNKPLVITKYGGTKSYFKDKAFYVNWRSIKEIKKGIITMFQKEAISTKEMMEQYPWDKIAEMYVNEYINITNPR